jgi:hypothetical protein
MRVSPTLCFFGVRRRTPVRFERMAICCARRVTLARRRVMKIAEDEIQVCGCEALMASVKI